MAFSVTEVEVERDGSREWLNCTVGNKRSISVLVVLQLLTALKHLPLRTPEVKYQDATLVVAL